MFHICGFTESQDSAVLVPAAALADQALQINGDDIIVPNDLTALIMATAFGPDITRAQLQSPSIRRQWNQEIMPVIAAALPTNRQVLQPQIDSPLILDAAEQLNGLMAESNAAASRVTIMALLADVPPSPVSGDIRSIRVTGTGTAVANAWTNLTLTFNDVLPAGTYALVGADFFSTNMQAFRFVFKGGMYRPGFIGASAASQLPHPLQRYGGLGVWGEFAHNTPPSIDVLCNAADSAFSGILDLMFLR